MPPTPQHETLPCVEVFRPWPRVQREVAGLARRALLPPRLLRSRGFLSPGAAERVADWFTRPRATARPGAVRAAYNALERETAVLAGVIRRGRVDGGLGVRVHLTHGDADPYDDAAQLCADLRQHRSMQLRTIACDPPHPLMGGAAGGAVDQLRVVHDVFGHAALGVGFDLQSEFATWLQCRTLFSAEARRAAFCELVGAVTAFVVMGEKPALRADLPPAELLAACDVDAIRLRALTPVRRLGTGLGTTLM